MGRADPAKPMRIAVSVAFSARADEVDEVRLELDAGATVNDAVLASGLAQRHPTFDLESMPCGIWGTLRASDWVLRHGDRVELYRPLQVEPKEGRRRRQQTQRAKVKARD